MNNEPVAWMQSANKELPDGCECVQSVGFFKVNDTDVPLYTHPTKELDEQFKKGFEAGKEEGWKAHKFHHPAPQPMQILDDGRIVPVFKTLTDEEIDTIVRDFFGEVESFYDFRLVIRRCIRKAQEK